MSFSNMKLITVSEVAHKLQVPERTVRRFFETRRLPAFQIGRKWFIRELDLHDFIAKALEHAKLSQKF